MIDVCRRIRHRPRYAAQVISILPRVFIGRVIGRREILLVRRYAGIGDIICTLPAVMSLKQANPKILAIFETRHSYMPVVSRCRQVDLVIEEGSLTAEWLRKFKVKTSLYPLLPDEQKPPQSRPRRHLTEEFQRSFGLETLFEESARLHPLRRAVQEVKRRLKTEQISEESLIVIHPGPTWQVKEWPEGHWAELVAQLSAAHDVTVIQIGVDVAPYDEIRQAPRIPKAKNWIGTLTLDQTLALLSLTKLFIGVDSGMLHLAGTVRTPCIGLFGPTDPMCFLPRNKVTMGITSNVPCLACHHHAQGPRHWQSGCEHAIRCMSELSPDEVFAACEKLLSPKRAAVSFP